MPHYRLGYVGHERPYENTDSHALIFELERDDSSTQPVHVVRSGPTIKSIANAAGGDDGEERALQALAIATAQFIEQRIGAGEGALFSGPVLAVPASDIQLTTAATSDQELPPLVVGQTYYEFDAG